MSSSWVYDSQTKSYQRPLGSSELAYYYPSLQNGLGDMFLHIAFRAQKRLVTTERVVGAWTVLRSRHPSLMSRVVEDENGIPRFRFSPYTKTEEALADTSQVTYFKNDAKEKLISDYMNGPRTLSSSKLSYVIISERNPNSSQTEGEEAHAEYDLLMCAPHYLGDGASLHQCTHELLCLLSNNSDTQLKAQILIDPNRDVDWHGILPLAAETRLKPLISDTSRWAKAASEVNIAQTLRKEIGGHTFPRTPRGPQNTVLNEFAFTEEETSRILAKCKKHAVTINNAMFIVCAVAWARVLGVKGKWEDPVMMYTAINLRPFLSPPPSIGGSHSPSYWFVALSYYNIVLPSFPPAPTPEGKDSERHGVFWYRTRNVKAQTRKIVVNSSFLKDRALRMADFRAARVIPRGRGKEVVLPTLPSQASEAQAPSKCLLGLSLIGNLDSVYTRSSYARDENNRPKIDLQTVTTASRQKQGGMLFLEHTFAGRLNLHLCWDENGFEDKVVEAFWDGVRGVVREYLL
ncbi:hypothetical protein E1B28_012553 [Marasmius oreades]|uniref:Uncharacterized protein n=1 Tax=Marasmius oreades TaxID=181124 RepID=A0A9P7RRU0_9AGAR|nr:uncharacterized protein E1B28_012553 [Marasmius oreades]KAG7088574.1 hypothetical protein E1B28_012553 [Marasmius oreades]